MTVRQRDIDELLESLKEIREDLDSLKLTAKEHADVLAEAQNEYDAAMEGVLSRLVRRYLSANARMVALGPDLSREMSRLYTSLGVQSQVRHHLLTVLAAGVGDDELHHFTELVVSDPPPDAALAASVFLTLTRHPGPHLQSLFPRLLDGVSHTSVATPILDVANFGHRKMTIGK